MALSACPLPPPTRSLGLAQLSQSHDPRPPSSGGGMSTPVSHERNWRAVLPGVPKPGFDVPGLPYVPAEIMLYCRQVSLVFSCQGGVSPGYFGHSKHSVSLLVLSCCFCNKLTTNLMAKITAIYSPIDLEARRLKQVLVAKIRASAQLFSSGGSKAKLFVASGSCWRLRLPWLVATSLYSLLVFFLCLLLLCSQPPLSRFLSL